MNEEQTANTLQRCLERLEAGEPVESILRDLHEDAAILAPLLAAVGRLWELKSVSPRTEARNAALARALAAQERQRATPRTWWPTLFGRRARRLVIRVGCALILVVALLGVGVARAQTSLPGDTLYPVKRGSEQVYLQLTFAPAKRAALYLAFADRRVSETLQLAASRRPPDQSSLMELARDYDLAGQAIRQAEPGARAGLLARYTTVVREHAQKLSAAAASAAEQAGREVLARAANVSATAVARLPELAPAPGATATPLMPSLTPTTGQLPDVVTTTSRRTAPPQPVATRTATPRQTPLASKAPAPATLGPTTAITTTTTGLPIATTAPPLTPATASLTPAAVDPSTSTAVTTPAATTGAPTTDHSAAPQTPTVVGTAASSTR